MPSERDKATWNDPGPSWRDAQPRPKLPWRRKASKKPGEVFRAWKANRNKQLSETPWRAIVFYVLVINWLCHVVTTATLFAYIQRPPFPTSASLDFAFFCLTPIALTTITAISAIVVITFGRR